MSTARRRYDSVAAVRGRFGNQQVLSTVLSRMELTVNSSTQGTGTVTCGRSNVGIAVPEVASCNTSHECRSALSAFPTLERQVLNPFAVLLLPTIQQTVANSC